MSDDERMYRLHSMFGPTVFGFDSLEDGLQRLMAMRHSNGGTYRLLDKYGKEYARINTYATYWPLCYEANRRSDAA